MPVIKVNQFGGGGGLVGSKACLERAASVLWILFPGSLGQEGEADLLGSCHACGLTGLLL